MMWIKAVVGLFIVAGVGEARQGQSSVPGGEGGPGESRFVVRKLDAIIGAAAQKSKDYELLQSAEARTDEERLVKFLGLTRISKSIMADYVSATAYYRSTGEARAEARVMIQLAIRKMNEFARARLDSYSPLLDALLENPKIVEALRQDLDPVRRAEILKLEFASNTEAARLLGDLASQVGQIQEQVAQLERYGEHIARLEKRWEEFASSVQRERARAERMLQDNEKEITHQLELAQVKNSLEKIRVFEGPPMMQAFCGDPPPVISIRVPEIPTEGSLQVTKEVQKPLDAPALLKALEQLVAIRGKKVQSQRASGETQKKEERP